MNRKSLLGYSGAINIENNDWVFISPSPDALRIFGRTGLKPDNYITMHDGFDTSHRLGRRSTKQWPADYWRLLVDKLRLAYPELKIVQTGGANSKYYQGVDVDLVGKASFDEVAWLLKYAICHIDSESGLVRLAREVGGKSIVVFGPTDPDFFGFAENVNLRPNKCGNCFWSAPDWLINCPKGLAEPECTTSIEPEHVLAALDTVMDQRRKFMLNVASAEFFQQPVGPCFDGSIGKNTESFAPVRVRNFEGGDLTQDVLTTPDGHVPQAIVAAIRDRVRKASVSVALAARLEDGKNIESCLTKLNGLQVTWFQLEGGNESKNYRPAIRKSKAPEGITESQNEPAVRAFESRPANLKYDTELRYGSALNIPAEQDTFDFVVLASRLGDRLQVGFALREMLRILKPEGILVWTFACYSGSSYQSPLPNGALTREQLKGVFDDLSFISDGGAIDRLQSDTQAVIVVGLNKERPNSDH